MARRGLATWLSAGSLLVGLSTVVVSFMGCYDNLAAQSGKCVGPDDDNPCTVPTCSEGSTTAVQVAAPDDPPVECARGENAGVCKKGLCELDCGQNCKCASDAECPPSTACVTWTCDENKECKRTDAEDMKLVDTADPNDCKKTVCISGAPQLVADELDVPMNVENDCKKPACNGMTPTTANDDDDAPPDMTPGDCQKPACNNGKVESAVDDTDEPVDTECIDKYCAGGLPSQMPAAVATPCMDGTRVCNSDGQCADCLSALDWGQCGGISCPVKMCNGELCAADGTRCKSGFCADTVCCDNACSAACKSCNLADKKGQCTDIPYYEEDPFYGAGDTCDVAVAGSKCDGKGNCLRIGGTMCNLASQCISGDCTDGKCRGATGELCSGNAGCVSMMCVMGACK